MRQLFFAAVFFLCLAGQAQAAAPLSVVASFSILGDMIEQIGGPEVSVSTLVGRDQDAHSYEPAPDAVKKLAKADLIAINGLHFEGWMTRLIEASGSKAKLLVASAGVRPRLLEEGGHDHHHEAEGIEGPAIDPHAWQDPQNGMIYAKNIAAALCEERRDICPDVTARAKAYIKKIKELEEEMRVAFAKIPQENRKIITNHDAFGYWGQAFGIRFLSPMGMSTEAEPSARAMGNLIDQIKKEKVSQVFIENMSSAKVMEQIARDSGARLGGTLYADALSATGGAAPTYMEMLKINGARMLAAMRP